MLFARVVRAPEPQWTTPGPLAPVFAVIVELLIVRMPPVLLALPAVPNGDRTRIGTEDRYAAPVSTGGFIPDHGDLIKREV